MSDENPDDITEPPHDDRKLKILSPTYLMEKGSGLYEGLGFAFTLRFVNACFHGYYVFKKNAGDLYVGAATFFGLLSIIPILSCATFLLGLYHANMALAHESLFKELYQIVPATSHGLINQLGQLTQSHLKNTPLTFLNLALLVWSSVAFFSTLVKGLLKVTSTKESGGAMMETLRALGVVISFGVVLLCCFELGEKGNLTKWMISLFPKTSYTEEVISTLAQWQVFTTISSAVMVTGIYKWLLATSLKSCLEGAITFIASFLVLKSFYWIYLHYNEASTTALFGGFAPLVVSILWGYFLLSGFMIGACVASLPRQKKVIDEIPKFKDSWEEAA